MFYYKISPLRDFVRSYNKTSYGILKRDPICEYNKYTQEYYSLGGLNYTRLRKISVHQERPVVWQAMYHHSSQ